MFKIGDVIRDINDNGVVAIVKNVTEFGVVAIVKNVTEVGVTVRSKYQNKFYNLDWEDCVHYEFVDPGNRTPREIIKELSDHIHSQFDETRKNESEIHKLKEQVKQLTQELKYAKVRAKSDDNAQFVAFCAFLIMTILFAFTFGLWVTG